MTIRTKKSLPTEPVEQIEPQVQDQPDPDFWADDPDVFYINGKPYYKEDWVIQGIQDDGSEDTRL